MVCSQRASHSKKLIGASLIAVLACGGGGDSPAAPETHLVISVQTFGFDTDADGYSAQVGGQSSALNPNASVTLSGLQSGSQTVTLSGVAPNCFVTGSNPLTVQVVSGQTATAAFQVSCTAKPGGSYRIAMMTNRDPAASLGAWEITVINSDGSVTPLTSNAVFDGYPVFSPDGTKIVFASSRDGTINIYVMNQDGTGVVRLTTTPAPSQDRFPSWSPDGTKIVFESTRTGSTEIYTMNADGSNVVQL